MGGRYVITGVVGRGGMGTVFLAKQQPVDREVAVKVLHQQMASDELALHRFQNEAQTISRLNHPNIVTMYDFGRTDDGSLYLAMELLKGPTVVDEIQRRGAFAPKEAFKICRDVARALAAAHRLGIVHRDLKPENIMLAETASGERVIKVLDFGLAKMASDREPRDPARPATEADVIMGTPGYMSPEQIHGMPLDGRADLYALGVIWWELLTGRQLFFGKSPIEVLMRHLEEKPPAPQHVRPGLVLPPDALSLLGRLLEKDRDRRPADGEEVAALFAALEQDTWQVKPAAQASLHQPPTTSQTGEWDAAFSQLDSGGSHRPAVGTRPPPGTPVQQPGPITFQVPSADPPSSPMPAARGPADPASAPMHAAPGLGSAPMPAARGPADPASAPMHAAPGPGSSPFPASPSPAATPFPSSPAQSGAAFPASPAHSGATFPASPPGSNPFPPSPGRSGAAFPAASGTGSAEGAPITAENPLAALGLDDAEVPVPGGRAFDPNDDSWKARPAAADKPQNKERLWTLQRGDRREQGVPESTIKRMAKEGKLLPTDLLSLPGESPRPAHTFPSLGVAAPTEGAPEPRPTPVTGPNRPVGSRRKSRKPLILAAIGVAVVGGGAGLYVARPDLVEAAVPWLGDLGAKIVDLSGEAVDSSLSGGAPSPVAHLRPSWEASHGKLERADDVDPQVAELILEADKAYAAETRTGDAKALAALQKALLLDERNLPAIGRMLIIEAEQPGAPAALKRIDADAVLHAALARDDDEPWLVRARAAIALARGDAAAARVDLERLQPSLGDDAAYARQMARTLLEVDPAQAGTWVAKAQQLTPRSTKVAALRGALARRDMRLAAAAKLLDERLAKEPEDRLATLERARLFADDGKPDRGAALLRQWLAHERGDDDVRLLAARLHLAAGDVTRARSTLAKAPNAGTQGPTARAEMSAFRVALDEAPSRTEATALLNNGEVRAMTHVAAGLASLKQRSTEAVKHFRQAIEAPGAERAPWVLRTWLGEAELRAGRLEDALASFQWAQQQHPTHLPAHLGEVLVLLRLSRPAKADEALQQLMAGDLLAFHDELDPHVFPPHDIYGWLDDGFKELTGAKHDAYVVAASRALVALGTGDLGNAVFLAGSALRKRRNDPLALTLLGAAELMRARPRKAVARVGMLEVRDDLPPAARLVLARALIGSGASHRGRKVLRPLEDNAAFAALAERLTGEAELAEGNPPKGARHLAAAYAKDPNDRVTRQLLAAHEADRQ